MAGAGAVELLLADTIGVGVPAQVRRLVPPLVAGLPGPTRRTAPVQDTRDTARATRGGARGAKA